MIIGPWIHNNYSQKVGDIDFGPEAALSLRDTALQWYDCYLKQKDCEQIHAWPQLKIFHMGENRWTSEDHWPLPQVKLTPYYFHSAGHAKTRTGDGALTTAAPVAEKPDLYTYDPAAPTPIIFPADSLTGPAAQDQRATESRPDMLVFSSAPLAAPVQVTGRIHVRLWAASSAPDTDWVARLVDVHPDGYAQRLVDGQVRARFRKSFDHPSLLEPGKIYEYTIELWDISHVFLKGHGIRVEIASSMFPIFSRNLNTGKDNETTTEMQPARQTIYHDAEHPSQILLPVLPR